MKIKIKITTFFTEEKLTTVDKKQLAIIAKLRDIALQQMRKTGYSAQFRTLQKTEVANELFADNAVIEKFKRLLAETAKPEEMEEFIKFCTIKIKHNLIDYMRRKFAEKRGGNLQFVSLDDSLGIFAALEIKDSKIGHLNEALEKLEKESSFHAEIIDKKCFLGLKNKEIAEHLKVSLSKVEKNVHFAIVWLKHELSK